MAYPNKWLPAWKRTIDALKSIAKRACAERYRRAGGQRAIDLGADLSAVSRNLGHSTTVTTERHYARVKMDRAFEELERGYSAPKLNSR